jgi:hypothetical protein
MARDCQQNVSKLFRALPVPATYNTRMHNTPQRYCRLVRRFIHTSWFASSSGSRCLIMPAPCLAAPEAHTKAKFLDINRRDRSTRKCVPRFRRLCLFKSWTMWGTANLNTQDNVGGTNTEATGSMLWLFLFSSLFSTELDAEHIISSSGGQADNGSRLSWDSLIRRAWHN